MAGESAYSLTPDDAWIVGSALAAAIAAGPAYLAARKNKRTASNVKDTLAYEFGRLHERLDSQDRALTDVQAWQAEHTTEHAVSLLTRRGLEIRRRDKT